ncbi:MAG: metallophosphoesterase [Prevotella sp.]|nr:metallophosphoesterase [Prevotella sp.]
MKILHLSDTHGCHHRLRDLPDADIVVHSGDFCMVGTEQEAIDFLNWFCDLPYRHKIFICGNHDDCLYGAKVDGLDPNVHYLCNSVIEIDGLKLYGVPMFMGDCVTDRQSRNYARVPDDTDILITHSPVYGILDFDDNINYGSEELLHRMSALNLKALLFGHIHAQHGLIKQSGIIFSNGAIMNSTYDSLNAPNIIEI